MKLFKTNLLKQVVFYSSIILNIAFAGYFLRSKWNFKQSQRSLSFSNNPQYDEQTAIFPAYTAQRKIAFLGDSHFYKVHLDELLDMPVCNRGIGSDIVKGMYERIDGILKVNPSIVFICAGANDAARALDIDSSLYYYSKILDTLRSKSIAPVIIGIPRMVDTIPNGRIINKKIDELNSRLRTMPVDYIDIAYEGKDYQADGVHLTGTGYLKWKQPILKVIEKYHP